MLKPFSTLKHCSIDDLQSLAEENLTLFLHCFAKGHPALQTTTLHILCDIFAAHPSVLSPPTTNASTEDTNAQPPPFLSQKQLLKPFSKGLKAAHAPDVQAAATVALCKLLLLRIVASPPKPTAPDAPAATEEDDEAADVLRQLAIAYFDGAGEAASLRDNPAARQALSYFLPAFAHGRAENATCLAHVAPAVIKAVAVRRAEEAELDSDDDEDNAAGAGVDGSRVKPKVVADMLLDWTDPRKLIIAKKDDERAEAWQWGEAGKREGRVVDGRAHLILAQGTLERALGNNCLRDERKVLLMMLGKAYVSADSSPELITSVLDLAREAVDEKIAPDATSRNALNKFVTALEKAQAATEGKDRPVKGRKSAAPSSSARQTGSDMTVIEEGTEVGEEQIKMEAAEADKMDIDGGNDEDDSGGADADDVTET